MPNEILFFCDKSSQVNQYCRGDFLKDMGLPVRHFFMNSAFSIRLNDSSLEINQQDNDYTISLDSSIFLWPSSFQAFNARLGFSDPDLDFSQLEYSWRSWQVVSEFIFWKYAECFQSHPKSIFSASNKIITQNILDESNIPTPITKFQNFWRPEKRPGVKRQILKGICDSNSIGESDAFAVSRFSSEAVAPQCIPFMLQAEVQNAEEFRVYYFGESTATFAVDFARNETPDYKFCPADETIFNRVDSCAEIDKIVCNIAKYLEIDFFSADILYQNSNNSYGVIDINPHGSWFWLPDEHRHDLDLQFLDYLCSKYGF